MTIKLRRFLLTGGSTGAYHLSPDPKKWHEALMLAGGTLGNLVVVTVVVALFWALVASRTSVNFAVVVAGYAIIAGQLVAIVINLIPSTFRAGPSDGKRLIALFSTNDFRRQQFVNRIVFEGRVLLEKAQYEEALSHFERGCAALPTDGYLLSFLIDSAGKVKGPRAAVQCYHERAPALITNGEIDRAGAIWASVNAAGHALLCADKESLSFADQLSQQAIEVLPDVPVLCALRGAVLIELGNHDAGLELLIPSIRQIESREDRLYFVPYLAKGERARGDFEWALEFEGFGEHLAKVL